LKAEDTEKIFYRGYRTEQAKDSYPAGTGFGLYIAKRIITIHEGTIIASTNERGLTVFKVTLSVRGLEGKARIRGPKDHSAN
jgi:signal transduction histidine kinase